jgi:pilus assembly protein CpaB
MMRRQTLIALGIALVLGVIAVYLANTFLTSTEQKAAAVPVNMTKVAVAVVPLDYGVDITPDKIRFADYPAASVPPGSFRSLAELLPAGKRRVALRPMLVNEPILATKVSGEGQGASIAALLPDGMRAAAVRLNDVSGVAGFVLPNDSVDVLITRQPVGAASQQTDVLLQNIRVIATDQAAQSANGQPVVAKTATLEVNPIDAQKLALAQQIGQLSLVLRKPGEDQNGPTAKTVSLADLRFSLYGGGNGARYTMAAGNRPVGTGLSGAMAGAMYGAADQINAANRPARRPVVVRRSGPATPIIRRPPTDSIQVIRGTEGSNYEVGGYGS